MLDLSIVRRGGVAALVAALVSSWIVAGCGWGGDGTIVVKETANLKRQTDVPINSNKSPRQVQAPRKKAL